MGDSTNTKNNKPEWLQQYDLIGKIGEGTYGLVFLARIKSSTNRGKSIAIKKFKQSKDGDGVSPTAIREIMVLLLLLLCLLLFAWNVSISDSEKKTISYIVVQLLREITHENVVKLVNVHITHVDMSLYLAFDYAEHDLYVSTIFYFHFQALGITRSIWFSLFSWAIQYFIHAICDHCVTGNY